AAGGGALAAMGRALTGTVARAVLPITTALAAAYGTGKILAALAADNNREAARMATPRGAEDESMRRLRADPNGVQDALDESRERRGAAPPLSAFDRFLAGMDKHGGTPLPQEKGVLPDVIITRPSGTQDVNV